MYAECMSYDSWRMEWVPQDEPTVQRQRGKWTVRQGGYDPSTGRRKVRQRILAIGQRAVEVLEEHRTRQAAEHVVLGLDVSDVELVFTSEVGGWIDPNNIGRIMERLAKDAGVPRLTPKGLRHTAQSIGRVVVGDDKIMQERLGHADIGITLNTYTHTVSEQHRRAGDLIDGVFE